jgi:multiple sugar transport system substrate-binding protein
LAIAFVAVLAGCDQEQRTLVIASSFAREVTEKEVYQDKIFDAFEKEHNVKIEFNTYSEVGSLYDKINTEQESNEVVTDLVIAHYSDMVNYIGNNDYMVNLNDLEDEMSDRNFSEAFDSSTNKDGNRYFFPINTDVYLSIARNEAFDFLPAGVTEADVLAGDYTWDDFVAWADGTNVKTAIKGQSGKLIIYQVGGMALSHTDTIEGTFPGVNTEANIKAWNDILEMKNNDAIHPQSTTVASTQELLESNAIQLAFEHLSVVGLTYDGAPAQFKVFPGPKGDSGKAGTIAGGHGIGVVKGSENQELAEEFVKWMTAKEQIVHAALGSIPPLAEATEALGSSAADEVVKKGIETITNSNVEGLQMIPDYTEWGAVKGVSDGIFAKIMDGTITTEEQLLAELNTAQAALEALKK